METQRISGLRAQGAQRHGNLRRMPLPARSCPLPAANATMQAPQKGAIGGLFCRMKMSM